MDVSSIFFFPVQVLKLAVTRGYPKDSNNFGTVRLNPKTSRLSPWPWPSAATFILQVDFENNYRPSSRRWEEVVFFVEKWDLFQVFLFFVEGTYITSPQKNSRKKVQNNFQVYCRAFLGLDTC